MNSTAPNSANQGKLAGQPVYPIKSGKMRQQPEMTSASTGVAPANFNGQINQQQMMAAQQQYLNNGQAGQRNASNSASMAAAAADSSIYKIKSSQNIRLDDDIARDRVLVNHNPSASQQNDTPQQPIQNMQQQTYQMHMNGPGSQNPNELLCVQQQQQLQMQQKMTQSNFFQ